MKYLIIVLLFLSCRNGSGQSADSDTVTQTLDQPIVQLIIEKVKSDGKTEGGTFELSETNEYVTLSNNYDWGRTSVDFSKIKSEHVFGDLKNDGHEDAIIQASAYYGGNSEHLVLYVFSKTETDEWKLICEVNASDEQLKGCDKGKFFPEKIENGFLIGESQCFKDSDPRCCPSLKYRTTARLENNRLVLVEKEKK